MPTAYDTTTRQAVPIGTVLPMPLTGLPVGYLLCDGSTPSRSLYAALFNAIGISHGAGDGSTTFHIPDYRGRFLRGVDGGAGRDPDRSGRSTMNTGGNSGDAVGSVQGHEFYSHTHIQNPHNHAQQGANNGTNRGGVMATSDGGSIAVVNATSDATATNQNAGGSETRPTNAGVNFMIRYA